jgi:hypothetical protein
MTLTIEIPALDRLCDILEERQRGTIIKDLKDEIVARLKEAAEGGAPKPEFEEVAPAEDHPWKDEAKAQNEATSSVTADAAPPSPEGKAQEAEPVTLEGIQLAAAQMRDQGKLKAVTDLFPEFGIKKLSDLKGEKLQAFGERLRAMGAKV